MRPHRQRPTRRLIVTVLAALLSVSATASAPAQSVEIFSAGSLRTVVNAVAQEMRVAYNIEVKPTFGPSGTLRGRIENGESPDLFLSADLAAPRKLEAQGRTLAPVAVFARNRMCIVSRRSAGLTTANMLDRMLLKGIRLKTSTPVADPSGDYAWAIFDRIEAVRPGAGSKLKEKAQASMSLSAAPATLAQSPGAALFAARQIDVWITYCSGSAALEKEMPELQSIVVPPQLDPHPVDGMALLSMKPEAMRVAMFLFSEKGQAIIAGAGLVPLMDATGSAPGSHE
jgi:ABC-type molybdate transport system substrate-binding protein